MFHKRKRVYDDDDGRVIADMNIEGTPWYKQDLLPQQPNREPIELTKEEKRAMIGGMLKAAFLVVGVIVTVYLLFILFCLYVWLR